MGLFTIVAAAKTANNLLSDKEVRNNLFNASKEGLSIITSLFDTDDDGDFDEDDFNNLVEYAYMIASILGQAAYADGVVNESEEEVAWEVLHETCFDDGGIFPEESIAASSISKKELKSLLIEKFKNPYSIKKIANYAKEMEIEEIFYEFACIIVSADKVIEENEREFLNEIGSHFELSKFDIKRIEKNTFDSKLND